MGLGRQQYAKSSLHPVCLFKTLVFKYHFSQQRIKGIYQVNFSDCQLCSGNKRDLSGERKRCCSEACHRLCSLHGMMLYASKVWMSEPWTPKQRHNLPIAQERERHPNKHVKFTVTFGTQLDHRFKKEWRHSVQFWELDIFFAFCLITLEQICSLITGKHITLLIASLCAISL